jgi:hypothetical protein
VGLHTEHVLSQYHALNDFEHNEVHTEVFIIPVVRLVWLRRYCTRGGKPQKSDGVMTPESTVQWRPKRPPPTPCQRAWRRRFLATDQSRAAGARSKTALWEVHTTPPPPPPRRGDCCLGVKACGEADVATGECSLGSWRRCRCGRWCCSWGSVGRRVQSGASVVGLVQHVGGLDPIGRHGDRLAAHKELQRFLSPREDPAGAAVRGLKSPACCVLAEKDMRAIMEVLVHEYGW